MTTAAPPSRPPAPSTARARSLGPDVDLQSTKLDVTPTQRGFLDALAAAGVHPSSELEALSIGSHVCQAHAAGQSDQAVWDYIAPDGAQRRQRLGIVGAAAHRPRAAGATQATADYIRIATQRLC